MVSSRNLLGTTKKISRLGNMEWKYNTADRPEEVAVPPARPPRLLDSEMYTLKIILILIVLFRPGFELTFNKPVTAYLPWFI